MTSGFGRFPRIDAIPARMPHANAINQYIDHHTCIARGLGRSYGDSALSHHMLDTSALNHMLTFNDKTGVLHAQSGVSLYDIIHTFLPQGFFPSVVPGTQFVSLGGAIASDIHGKNHHHKGTFGQSVVEITLAQGQGSYIQCSKEHHSDLFFATCGGMGLTGIIISAKIQLDPIASGYIKQSIIKTTNLKDTLMAFDEYNDSPYSVAWIDTTAKDPSMSKGLVILGTPAIGSRTITTKKVRCVPCFAPKHLLNRYSMQAFNGLYYKLQKSSAIVSLFDYFFPLDSLKHWNRLYGRQGFLQYQCGFPKATSYEAIEALLAFLKKKKFTPFLSVLKKMGPENNSPLSFPFSGYSLAMDIPYQPACLPVLAQCDQIVLEHGGRLYLAKDARMSANILHTSYPRIEAFTAIRHKYNLLQRFQSLQSQRLEI